MADDFLTKKKETTPIVDLSKTTVTTDEEFKKLLEKVPDFKIRPDKVETVKIREKNFKFKTAKKEKTCENYTFMNPIPVEMQHLDFRDLAAVSIDWRMLTTCRPKNKVEEQFFSKLVELSKLETKTLAQVKREDLLNPPVRRSKNKAGILETRLVTCKDCGEELCDGKYCKDLGYDAYARLPDQPKQQKKSSSPDFARSKTKGKRKTKKTSQKKSKPNIRRSKSLQVRGKEPKVSYKMSKEV